jgi:hypothetical protein
MNNVAWRMNYQSTIDNWDGECYKKHTFPTKVIIKGPRTNIEINDPSSSLTRQPVAMYEILKEIQAVSGYVPYPNSYVGRNRVDTDLDTNISLTDNDKTVVIELL